MRSTPSTRIAARTPARLFVGRAGPGYRTATQLRLRADHAAARDAVHESIDAARDLAWVPGVLALSLPRGTKQEYLLRPDLGRRLDDDSRRRIAAECPAGADLQIVLGDGLSPAASSRRGRACWRRSWRARRGGAWGASSSCGTAGSAS